MVNTSVIVVSFNSRAYLPNCLESIRAELGPDDELILVDCDSSDGSAEFAESIPDVRVIRGPNLGYAGGVNLGAAAALGRYLIVLNPDTVVQPGAFAALLAPLAESDDIGLTTPCILHMQRPEMINTCGLTLHYTGLAYCRGAGRVAHEFAELADVDAVSGAAFAIRHRVFDEVGGFDAAFFMYSEDVDLSLRARLAGYRCRYVPEARILHDYRIGFSPTKAFYLERNRHMMLLKNLSRATYMRLLPGLLLGELLTWGYLLVKGPRYWGVKPKVYAWLWQRRHTFAVRRRAARKIRRCEDRSLIGRMTHRLDLRQMAGKPLAALAGAFFHPAFWIARQFIQTGAPS